MKRIVVSVIIVMVAMAVGCKSTSAKNEAQSKAPEKGSVMSSTSKNWVEPKKSDINPAKKYVAIIKTNKGVIECELFAKDAPLSVTNFKYLADNGFYTGLTFHRVEPGFVVQGGDPTATGSGGPGYTITAEINSHKHIKGALAWARTGDAVNPERRSSGSQFYITLKPTPFLDGAYTVFGQTIKGMDVVEKIQRGDKIESIEVKAK